jgi:hypothetical protein
LSSATNTFTTNQVISGSTTADLLRITQTGAGNALLVEDSTNPDSTPFVIDASGRAIVGNTTSVSVGGINPLLQVHNTLANAFLARWSANASGSELRMGKSRSATVGSFSVVSASDVLATINGYGDDGTEFILAGSVAVRAEGTISTGVVPGRLEFGTANSSGVNTERMRIDSAGGVSIGGTAIAAGSTLRLSRNITGATTANAVISDGVIQSDVTANARGFMSRPTVAAASFTIPTVAHFYANPSTVGAGATITNSIGFHAESTVGDNSSGTVTNAFGFYGNLASGTNRYNLYMNGTAANYFAGRLGVGATLTSGAMAQITNTTAADKVLVVKGAASQTGNLLDVQNSAGTILLAVNSTGRLYVDSDAPYAVSGFGNPNLSVGSNGTTDGVMIAAWYNTASGAPSVRMGKSRSGAQGTFGIVTSGDTLGQIVFGGDDGAKFAASARIAVFSDATPGLDSMPGRLAFFTTASSSTTPTERMRIDSAGQVGIGATPTAGRTLLIGKNITGSTSSFAVLVNANVQSDVTTEAVMFRSVANTQATSFTVPNLYHFQAVTTNIGAGSTVTSQYGFMVPSGFPTATNNNFAFYSDIAASTGRWNLYMNGTANNYLAGRLGVGATNTSGSMVQIVNTTATDDALLIRGAAGQSGYLTEWQNNSGTTVAYVSVDGTSSFGSPPDSDQAVLAGSIFN